MTWETRDLPVLKAIVEMTEEGNYLIRPHQIEQRLGMDATTVHRALVALAGAQPPFFQFTDSPTLDAEGPEIDAIRSPTSAARQAVGQWPSELLARRIVDGLLEAAESEPDEEKRGKLKQAAQVLGGTGWTVLLGVVGNAASKAIGL